MSGITREGWPPSIGSLGVLEVGIRLIELGLESGVYIVFGCSKFDLLMVSYCCIGIIVIREFSVLC